MVANMNNPQKKANYYITEYLKCKQDFEYFCRNYVFLDLVGGDVLFSPYKKQLELIDLIDKEKHVIVLKSRQIGISTIIKSYICWLTVFYENVVAGIVSKDNPEATSFGRGVRNMIEKIPEWMKPKGGVSGRGFAKKSEQSFILMNGSSLYVATVSNMPEKTLRGKNLTLLLIDEAAFINNIEIAWTAIVPALSTNQMLARKNGIPYSTILLSTPNKTVGVGKFYFEKYSRAISGEGILKPFVIHWRNIPELVEDPLWYTTQCELLDNDAKKIAQELELKFLPTEGSFFEAETVETMQNSSIEPMEKLKLFNGEIWKFADPIPDTFYIIGVDTASEQGEDKSAITIFEYESLEQVWEYQGKCKVLDFVKIVKVGASQYPGVIVVEVTGGYGNQVVEQLNEDPIISQMLYKQKKGENKLVNGLSTNSKTRPLMIDALYSYVNEFPETIKSERLALELTGLISKKNGRVEADSGCHDDLALSASMAYYVRKYDPPLLIDKARFSGQVSKIKSILNDNIRTVDEMTNPTIMKYIKDNIDKGEVKGFVDIMSLYTQG